MEHQPVKATLQAGKQYAWCACGKSQKQPFCDGSHSGTGITPTFFKAEKDGDKFLCTCKKTANAPFCDGSHNKS